MAAALLKDLGAEPFVSEAVIGGGVGTKAVSAKGCKIENVSYGRTYCKFTRIDECLPLPIPDDARSVLPLFPAILDMSRYLLAVNGLSGVSYRLSINGELIGSFSVADLEKGINLTTFEKGPIANQGKAVLAAVAAKEGLVGQARAQARAAIASDAASSVKEKFAALLKQIEEADAKIRDTAKPKTLKFELDRID